MKILISDWKIFGKEDIASVYPIQQNEIIEIDTIEELEYIRDKVGRNLL